MNDDTNSSDGNTYDDDDGIREMIVKRVVINALISVDV